MIKNAMILAAGFGKRLHPLTLNCPKPLLKIGKETLLTNTINFLEQFKISKVFINIHYLGDQIAEYINKKKFNLDIEIINDGKNILNTGGGILNMMQSSNEMNFLTFNPDTLWSNSYIKDIQNMEKFYFLNHINNILLLVNKNFSFDKELKGDFNLVGNKIKKEVKNNLIYTGCQIINKGLFKDHTINNFSISETWNTLISKDNLYGYESSEDFYHLTNLEIYEKLLKNK